MPCHLAMSLYDGDVSVYKRLGEVCVYTSPARLSELSEGGLLGASGIRPERHGAFLIRSHIGGKAALFFHKLLNGASTIIVLTDMHELFHRV